MEHQIRINLWIERRADFSLIIHWNISIANSTTLQHIVNIILSLNRNQKSFLCRKLTEPIGRKSVRVFLFKYHILRIEKSAWKTARSKRMLKLWNDTKKDRLSNIYGKNCAFVDIVVFDGNCAKISILDDWTVSSMNIFGKRGAWFSDSFCFNWRIRLQNTSIFFQLQRNNWNKTTFRFGHGYVYEWICLW